MVVCLELLQTVQLYHHVRILWITVFGRSFVTDKWADFSPVHQRSLTACVRLIVKFIFSNVVRLSSHYVLAFIQLLLSQRSEVNAWTTCQLTLRLISFTWIHFTIQQHITHYTLNKIIIVIHPVPSPIIHHHFFCLLLLYDHFVEIH